MTPDDVRTFVLRSQRILGLDVGGMARLCRVGKNSVLGWRSGRTTPRALAVLRIVDALVERKLDTGSQP